MFQDVLIKKVIFNTHQVLQTFLLDVKVKLTMVELVL